MQEGAGGTQQGQLGGRRGFRSRSAGTRGHELPRRHLSLPQSCSSSSHPSPAYRSSSRAPLPPVRPRLRRAGQSRQRCGPGPTSGPGAPGFDQACPFMQMIPHPALPSWRPGHRRDGRGTPMVRGNEPRSLPKPGPVRSNTRIDSHTGLLPGPACSQSPRRDTDQIIEDNLLRASSSFQQVSATSYLLIPRGIPFVVSAIESQRRSHR